MSGVRTTLVEMSAVIAVGVTIGLVVNALGDSGLDIGRNHFRKTTLATTTVGNESAKPGEASDSTIDADGFQLIGHEEAFELHESESFLDERCIFIDARDDTHYAEGHIPGAYQLDHYRVERYIDALLPICVTAEKIVVYCNGGKCEDSKLAAGDLIENGIDSRKVFVYTGGVAAWKEDGLPFERGERLSEDFVYLDEDDH